MQYVNVSHSSYLVSIGASYRLIYVYETTIFFLMQILPKAVSEHKNTNKFPGGGGGGHAPRSP